MNLLDTQIIDNDEVHFYFSDSIALRSVLSLILKNFSTQLDNKFVVPSNVWEKLDEAKVVYAMNNSDVLLGGVCFILDKLLNIATIHIVFKEGDLYTKQIHENCIAHLKNVAKKEEMSVLVHCVHKDNVVDIELAEHVNLKPTYYFLTQNLVGNDEE